MSDADQPDIGQEPAPAALRRRTLLTLAVAGAAGLAAEGADARRRRGHHGRTWPPGPTGPTGPTGSTGPTGPSGPVDVPDGIPIAEILADAGRVLGTDVGSLSVRLAVRCEWPSSALGCPVPGHAYLDVITPGYRVVVVGPGGVRLDYRGSDSGFRRCKASIRLPECPQIVCAIDSPCPPPVCDPEALGEAALACPGGNGVSAVSRSAPPTGRRRKRR